MSHYAIHAPFDMRGYDKRFAEEYSNPNDGHKWSDNEKRYSALIQGMDKSLGDIREYLKKNNLDKNTVIIFMADNGGLAISGRMGNKESNYPLSFGKGSNREGGIREPMIVYWPGVTKAESVCTTPVIIEDFFPTILEIAGAKNSGASGCGRQKLCCPAERRQHESQPPPALPHAQRMGGRERKQLPLFPQHGHAPGGLEAYLLAP